MQSAFPSLHKLQTFLESKSNDTQRGTVINTQKINGQTFYVPRLNQGQPLTSQSLLLEQIKA